MDNPRNTPQHVVIGNLIVGTSMYMDIYYLLNTNMTHFLYKMVIHHVP